jgi:hypothetical protein
MKSCIKKELSGIEAAGKMAVSKNLNKNLFVAYRNSALIDTLFTTGNNEMAGNQKESVFSTTGGSYYINGVPVIYSQDDEVIIYSNEYSEYCEY